MAAIRHIGVIGGGLAGLAAGLAAARAGVQATVFELSAAPAAMPVHIDVVPNLLRDLVGLGLGEACVRRGFPYRGTVVLDGDGQQRFEVPTPALAGAHWPSSLGLVYGELLALMQAAALMHGVQLQRGVAVQAVDARGAIVTADGRRHPTDLVVMASGEQLPTVAGQAPQAVPDTAHPQQWCHGLLPRPAAVAQAAWVIGRGALRALLVPVNSRQLGVALQQPAGTPATAAAMRQLLAGQGGLLKSLAGHWSDALSVWLRPVRSGVLAAPWQTGQVLRIGRSAHHLPPHFGQSAAQAIEDACVLGDLLSRRLSRPALMQAFMQRRVPRAQQVHDVTVQAAHWQWQPEAATDLRALSERLAPLVAQPA